MSQSFKDALRDELVDAAAREQRPRWSRSRRVLAAAAAVGVLALGISVGAAVLDPGAASASIEITEEDGRIFVVVSGDGVTLDEARDALEGAGVPVTVRPVRVGPSNLGRFVGYRVTEGELEQFDIEDDDGGAFEVFSIPADWGGHVVLDVGVPAADKSYELVSDAFRPGEPLHCVQAMDLPLREVAFPDDVDVTVRLYRNGTVTSQTIPLDDALDRPTADWLVVDALSHAANEVTVSVADGGRDSLLAPPLEPQDDDAWC